MGTSGSYNGPSGKNPLLPPWADSGETGDQSDDPDNGNKQPQLFLDSAESETTGPNPTVSRLVLPAVSWAGPKGIVSRIANGNPSASWRSAFRSYVGARGGAGNASRSATSGRATTARLGGFLSDVVQRGAAQAATRLGLQEYIGKDAESLLAALIDVLAPVGGLLEEAVARKSLIETLVELFDRCDVDAEGMAGLDRLDSDGMKDIIVLSVTNYVHERFQQELVSRVESGSVSEKEANELIEEAKEFIEGVVLLDLSDVDVVRFDWNGEDGKKLVDGIYRTAYSLLQE